MTFRMKVAIGGVLVVLALAVAVVTQNPLAGFECINGTTPWPEGCP